MLDRMRTTFARKYRLGESLDRPKVTEFVVLFLEQAQLGPVAQPWFHLGVRLAVLARFARLGPRQHLRLVEALGNHPDGPRGGDLAGPVLERPVPVLRVVLPSRQVGHVRLVQVVCGLLPDLVWDLFQPRVLGDQRALLGGEQPSELRPIGLAGLPDVVDALVVNEAGPAHPTPQDPCLVTREAQPHLAHAIRWDLVIPLIPCFALAPLALLGPLHCVSGCYCTRTKRHARPPRGLR